MSSISNSSESLKTYWSVPPIIDQYGCRRFWKKIRVKKCGTNFYKNFFKNIFVHMNDGLSKIPLLHMLCFGCFILNRIVCWWHFSVKNQSKGSACKLITSELKRAQIWVQSAKTPTNPWALVQNSAHFASKWSHISKSIEREIPLRPKNLNSFLVSSIILEVFGKFCT